MHKLQFIYLYIVFDILLTLSVSFRFFKPSVNGRLGSLSNSIATGNVVDDVDGFTSVPSSTSENKSGSIKFKVANTKAYQISLSNPFGPKIEIKKDALKELSDILSGKLIFENNFKHGRLEYIIKFLQSTYIPIQTIPFLNLAVSGRWEHMYSNIFMPMPSDNLSVKLFQEITPSQNDISIGKLVNIADFDVEDHESSFSLLDDVLEVESDIIASGELKVTCDYHINSRGNIDISGIDHTLIAEKMPADLDIEKLVSDLQVTIPFEMFDPSDTTIENLYIDSHFRITMVSGGKYSNVYNIFVRK